MRPINHIFRFILFTIIALIAALFIYAATIIGMLFTNWDNEYEELKLVHIEIYEWWKKTLRGEEDEIH